MLEKNLYSSVNYQVKPQVAAGKTSFTEQNVYMIAQAFSVLERPAETNPCR